MKRHILITALLLSFVVSAAAQNNQITAMRNVVPDGYNFWVYTPQEYDSLQHRTPVIIFLHGASLCGHDLNRVRRYGPLQALTLGRTIPALIIAPQNPGGAWNPRRINNVLEWTREHYPCDSTRIYVYGMSLGGYGTLDFAGTYPEKVAAAMALCGGTTLKNLHGLGKLPLWIMHGTADRAVPVKQSQIVVSAMKANNETERLRYDWLPGASHGALARMFYLQKTYDWLFSHALTDSLRPVERGIIINQSDFPQAYRNMNKTTAPRIVF